MKTIIETFVAEFEQEAVTTRKMLERIPDEKFGWQPHPKSMTIKQLATHLAELPSWVPMVLHTTELNFANNDYKPADINTAAGLLEYFEKNEAGAIEGLNATTEEELDKTWTMRSGDTIYQVYTKAEVVRVALSQTIHHRAQLGVFLRLLDIPIPGSYGPSADEQSF